MTSSSPEPPRLRRIRASALWSAYGDALGFITELADAKGVARRGAQLPLTKPVPWSRRIGGRAGPTVQLPAGCLSDDTQLRLATSRSIRGDGVFDAETFAKIELPVWSAYALGAGRGSLEAAANLRRPRVSWATNFFEGERSVYVGGGGNGAAMRIQPHVWAAGTRPPASWQTDVIANSVCTHGHMRGVLGAVFHAKCLHKALATETVPGPGEWVRAASELHEAASLIRSHDLLDHLWLGLWERHSAIPLEEAIGGVVEELLTDIGAIEGVGSGPTGYAKAVDMLGASASDQRGSGTKTSLLAALAAWLFADEPETAMATCANQIGTDTDSIATMAGALLGATLDEEPDAPLLDRAYIEREADRMWAIGEKRRTPTFPYPPLVTWMPPRSQLESLGLEGEDLAVAGLGPAQSDGEVLTGSGKNPGVWGWVRLWFGQRVLIKRRPRPKPLGKSQIVRPAEQYLTARLVDEAPRNGRDENRGGASDRQMSWSSSDVRDVRFQDRGSRPPTLHRITDEVIASGFDPEAVGRALLELAEREDGIELVGQYATILAKARLSRRDRDRRA